MSIPTNGNGKAKALLAGVLLLAGWLFGWLSNQAAEGKSSGENQQRIATLEQMVREKVDRTEFTQVNERLRRIESLLDQLNRKN